MIKTFLREVLLYSIKAWGSFLLIMSPIFPFLWLFDNFEFGIITRFNLFLLCLVAVFGVIALMGRTNFKNKEPKIKLKRAQWETALGVISWIKNHETTGIMLLMIAILIPFIPISWIWAQLYFIGALNSYLSAFSFFMLLILPFLLIPAYFIISLYESIIHPDRLSLNQLQKIISRLYSNKSLTGENLEATKKRFISVPSKQSKAVGTGLLIVIALTLVFLELSELGYIPEALTKYTFYVYLVIGVITIAMMALGEKKKSEFDEWIDSTDKSKGTATKNSIRNNGSKVDNFNLNPRLELAVSGIEKSVLYRLTVIVGSLLTLISAFYWLINFL